MNADGKVAARQYFTGRKNIKLQYIQDLLCGRESLDIVRTAGRTTNSKKSLTITLKQTIRKIPIRGTRDNVLK